MARRTVAESGRAKVGDPPPHIQSCETEAELRDLLTTAYTRVPRAVDLFCGAGGMSLGLERAGYTVVLGVDTDADALATHRSLCPGLSVDWDLGDPAVVERIGQLVADLGIELLAGGPPCQPFSKAGRSRLAHLVRTGKRDQEDLRAQLWRSMMRIVEIGRPRAVLMENVPDMVLDRDMLVLRTMTEELESLGYAVEPRLVDTFRYGVPQFRRRLLLVALEQGRQFEWPPEVEQQVRLVDAIGDLPPTQPGWRDDADGVAYAPPPNPSEFVQEMRLDVPDEDEHRLYDHMTRPVREDDREAFSLMDPSTKYSDLPAELRRYRTDIFDDKYKRLDWHDLSRTITAHLAKDGYWYIHPEQDRTITVREAARIQTFPDHVRFAGPPTAAFRQIGNAVPPRAAFHAARAIKDALRTERPPAFNTTGVSTDLADWMLDRHDRGEVRDARLRDVVSGLIDGTLEVPGLRWQVLLTLLLLPRVDSSKLEDAWSVVTADLGSPKAALDNDRVLDFLGRTLGREARLAAVREARDRLLEDPDLLDTAETLESVPGISRALARLVCRIVPDGLGDPVVATGPTLRLAARFWGLPVDEQDSQTSGRLSIGRLLGVDDEEAESVTTRHRASLAALALLELADDVCRSQQPLCGACPLRDGCCHATEHGFQPSLT